MGDTLALFAREGACLGRSVTSWTSASGSWPGCSTARRWRRSVREFGISRKTGYKIFHRYKGCGIEGLTDRSRRPQRHANQLPDGDREADRPPEAGVSHLGRAEDPRALAAPVCARRSARRSAPCTPCSTGTAWSSDAAKRRQRAQGTALSWPDAPNALWCADYKGEFMLADRRYCYPLTITDFASRYLLSCEALSSTREAYRVRRV